MRVKSVPRHLPRKDGIQGILKMKNGSTNMEFFPSRKAEGSGFVNIKTVIPQRTFEQWRPFSGEGKLEALDLTTKGSPPRAEGQPAGERKLQDTYLYQIMTDPELLRKISREKQVARVACPYCKREFASEAEVKRHQNARPDSASQLSCCACGKSFAQKRYLRYHQRCHSERNKYACDICTRKYSRQDNLTRHNIFHTNPDKFPCHSCERAFARKDLLNKHIKCHENKFKHYCALCQKYFRGPISLDNHNRLFHLVLPKNDTGDFSFV